MALFDVIQNRWELLGERERRLFSLLGVTFVLFVLLVLGYFINDGLSSIEEKNQLTREALRDIEEKREEYLEAKRNPTDVTRQITSEAPSMASYLEQIANEVGVQIPESNERQATTKGKFSERTIDVKLRGVTVEQLAQFLQRIETHSQIIVTQRLFVKTHFSQKEKLDVELTVATYERAKEQHKGPKPSEDKSDDDEERGG
ncbi:MAG: type 4a pilus biogenesis protein PilO [Deltaproteobacteria bacterium]|nr:type 4a pilus biogenesis protein PilO [Deltaproteobacteria bacterium]